MLKPIVYFFILFTIISCRKEPPVYQQRTPATFNPIQSDSCLLGEKILWYEDSIGADGEIYEIPFWRDDNFNIHDSLHINDVERLYSNYDITWFEENTVIIETKKLYTHARSFVRFIEFDQNGYQEKDTTFYNKVLGDVKRFENVTVFALDDPRVSTAAYQMSHGDGHVATTIILDKSFDVVNVATEKRWGMEVLSNGVKLLKNGDVQLDFEVVEGCGGCYDDYWWYYSVIIDYRGNFKNAYHHGPPDIVSPHFPSSAELKEVEKDLWSVYKREN